MREQLERLVAGLYLAPMPQWRCSTSALALGEAFKTVVEEGKFIHWDRLYSLGSFLLLLLPFYQGMNRYLLVTYGDVAALPTSGPFLVSAAFMVESALFFVLSRTLRPEEWQHFYWAVVVLLVIDSIWWILRAPPRDNTGLDDTESRDEYIYFGSVASRAATSLSTSSTRRHWNGGDACTDNFRLFDLLELLFSTS